MTDPMDTSEMRHLVLPFGRAGAAALALLLAACTPAPRRPPIRVPSRRSPIARADGSAATQIIRTLTGTWEATQLGD